MTFLPDHLQWSFNTNQITMNEKEYLTKEKYKALTEELEYLRTDRRKEVAEKLQYAKSLGDLSENAEYHEARDMQAMVEDRIAKLEHVIKNAVIVSTQPTDIVGVGSVITVIRDGQKDEKTYTITGPEEADLSQNKISMKSPFGEAAMGKKKGEKFTFTAPAGDVTYKIVEIK